MLYTQVYLLLLSVHVHYNLFCHSDLIQQQVQAECAMHELYSMTTTLMKIILSTGMMIIPFFGMIIIGMMIIPFLV